MTKMKIVLDGNKKSVNTDAASVSQLLGQLKISPQEALVKVNGKIRPESTPIKTGDKIEIIRVVFGG